MKLFIITLCALYTAYGAPETFVRWMELEPAETINAKPLPDDFVLSFKPYDKAWENFKRVYGKLYGDSVESYRYNLFQQNLQAIETHNQLYKDGKKSFYLGINHFADYEFEEFQKLNGYRSNPNNTNVSGSTFLRSSFVTLPDTVDWRQEGYVTPVKNQGQCGSCWSFSTTGSLEGQHYKKKGNLVSLSEQQLVDCSSMYGNHGCRGGLMDNAFKYIKQVGGLDTEKSYPYVAEQEDMCHFNHHTIAAHVTGFVDIPEGSETALQHAVATVGPVSIAIDAAHKSFMFYKGGVYDEPECSSIKLDHGVLAVGYGTDQGDDYWLVKNSWSEKWGEQGYVRMSRNKNNQCGVASKASYPLV